MNNLNNVVLEGHLYRDANEHNDRVYFKIAVNRSYRDSNSESGWSQVTSDVNCRLPSKLGKAVADKLTKGSHVKLVGVLNTYAGNEVKDVKSGKTYRQPMTIIDVAQIGVTQKGSKSQEIDPEDAPPF